MAKYRCNNKKCIDFDTIKEEYGTHTKYIGEETIDVKAYCPECGRIRELVEPNEELKGFTTNMHGSKNICKK